MLDINSIDLWTEQKLNHYECFNGCFVDGFENNKAPFNEYKVVKNCNCIITCDNKNINITNKHNAIVFYKKGIPVRLMVVNKNTDVEKCIEVALNQFVNNKQLKELYVKHKIKNSTINLNQKPIINSADFAKEIDVGSCDRWNLLYNMLKGSYTESESTYGNFGSCNYEFLPNLNVKYDLITNAEHFLINHKCAFINDIASRLVPVQENSKLTTKG